jgi:hypothetical protein
MSQEGSSEDVDCPLRESAPKVQSDAAFCTKWNSEESCCDKTADDAIKESLKELKKSYEKSCGDQNKKFRDTAMDMNCSCQTEKQ